MPSPPSHRPEVRVIVWILSRSYICREYFLLQRRIFPYYIKIADAFRMLATDALSSGGLFNFGLAFSTLVRRSSALSSAAVHHLRSEVKLSSATFRMYSKDKTGPEERRTACRSAPSAVDGAHFLTSRDARPRSFKVPDNPWSLERQRSLGLFALQPAPESLFECVSTSEVFWTALRFPRNPQTLNAIGENKLFILG